MLSLSRSVPCLLSTKLEPMDAGLSSMTWVSHFNTLPFYLSPVVYFANISGISGGKKVSCLKMLQYR